MKVVTPGTSRLKAAQAQAGSPDKSKHGKQRAEYLRTQAPQQVRVGLKGCVSPATTPVPTGSSRTVLGATLFPRFQGFAPAFQASSLRASGAGKTSGCPWLPLLQPASLGLQKWALCPLLPFGVPSCHLSLAPSSPAEEVLFNLRSAASLRMVAGARGR